MSAAYVMSKFHEYLLAVIIFCHQINVGIRVRLQTQDKYRYKGKTANYKCT
jgi:hypothetical protein